MKRNEAIYYLSCAFFETTNNCYYLLLDDDLEYETILDRVEQKSILFQEMFDWLMEELDNIGFVFKMNNQSKSIFSCIIKERPKIIDFYRVIQAETKSYLLNGLDEHYYLYYLESHWIYHLIFIFEDFIKNLDVPILYARYETIKPYFDKAKQWLKQELIDVEKNHLPLHLRDSFIGKAKNLSKELSNAWIEVILYAIDTYFVGENENK